MKPEDYREMLNKGLGETIAVKYKFRNQKEAKQVCSGLQKEKNKLSKKESRYQDVQFIPVDSYVWLFNRERLDDGIQKPEPVSNITEDELQMMSGQFTE